MNDNDEDKILMIKTMKITRRVEFKLLGKNQEHQQRRTL